MSMDFHPGSMVSVKLTAVPTNASATKTLSRVFARDPSQRKARKIRRRNREKSLELRQRGGRKWAVRAKAPPLCQPKMGDSCTVLATTAILRDLGSVSRFIEISAAN